MNVLWTKGKLNKTLSSKANEESNLHASGDGNSTKCCRLCGGSTSLRAFADSYMWEGVEQRYDQILYDCFGVMVTPADCLICEWCVRQLRCTERFKALVHAAFDKPASSSNPSLSMSSKRQRSDEEQSLKNKSIIALLETNMVPEKKKRKISERRANLNSGAQARRTNIQCKVCNQKYPMIVSCNSGKDFVCSRCKKNVATNAIPKKNKVGSGVSKKCSDLFSKPDVRGKKRSLFLTKKPSPFKRQQGGPTRIRNISKYKCAICTNKYGTAEHLADHIKAQHWKNVCPLCSKDLRTKTMLEKHMHMHKDHVSLNYFTAGPARFSKTKRDLKARGAREKRSL